MDQQSRRQHNNISETLPHRITTTEEITSDDTCEPPMEREYYSHN